MTSPDPEPRQSPGLQPGAGVPPGETPPGESGISGISHPEPPELRKGWGAMPITVIMVMVVLVAIGLIAMIVELIA
ncbi:MULTISPECIES: DUF6480 family protein [unclassified Streptomyces]|uniref:DUF6480 family protein n=1 Tax=unclassified Streptomyces TaxID=2593676 RepID=UPI0036E2A8AB